MAGRPARRARAEAQAQDARQLLERVFDEIPDLDEKWKALLEEAFDASREREHSVAITCKECGQERKYLVKVPVADWGARAKVLDLMLTQAKGKPVETQKIDVSVLAARSRQELEQMSEAELLAIAATTEPATVEAQGRQSRKGRTGRGRTSAARPETPAS